MKLDNFLFNSNASIDKLIWLKEGQLTTSNGSWDINIPHGLGATPFVNGVWSPDNWNTTHSVGSLRQNGQMIENRALAISSSSNVEFSGIYGTYGQQSTIKYRLWGVFDENSTLDVDTVPTQLGSNKFIFNTGYNYPKLFIEKKVVPPTTIDHNLGKIPFCDIWNSYDNGATWYLYMDGSLGSVVESGVSVTSSQLIIPANNYGPTNYYVRIYA